MPVPWRRLRRRTLRWLGPPGATGAGPERPLRLPGHAYLTARALVRAFYAGLLYLVCSVSASWPEWARATALDPLWPVAWSRLTGSAATVHVAMALSLLGSSLALLVPDRRLGRVLAFAGFLQFAAFVNSFGKIGHGYHAWVLTSFWLMFLPSGSAETVSRRLVTRQRYRLAVWAVLGSTLLCYSISGFWKVAVGLYQASLGEVHAFAPAALAYHIARRSLQTQSITGVGAFLVEHPWVGWPFYLATLYLEFFALAAAFRPRLHRLWGLGLVGMHLGSNLALEINHAPQVLLLGIMAVGSPFAPQRFRLRPTLADLPIVGWPWRRARPRPGTRRLGDPEAPGTKPGA